MFSLGERGGVMYAIRSLCHRTDIDMGRHGFGIDLAPEWREAVIKSGLTQEKINTMLERCGREWLDLSGFNRIFDPDNCGHEADCKKPPGQNSYPMHQPLRDLRVQWGQWGAEHISIPGNACGLDVDRGIGCLFKGGSRLLPHNIDSLNQKYLLLIVFTEIAESVLLFSRGK